MAVEGKIQDNETGWGGEIWSQGNNLQKSEMNLNDALHLHFIILYSPCELIFLEKVSRISWSDLFVAVENCSTINFAPAAI